MAKRRYIVEFDSYGEYQRERMILRAQGLVIGVASLALVVWALLVMGS